MRKRVFLKLVASLLISHLIIMIGRSDWLSVFADGAYYKDLLITFVSVFIVFEYVDRITQFLDKKYPWKLHLTLRTTLQVGLAVIIPCFMAVILTFLQSEFIYNQDLFETGYFKYEFQATILLVAIVNLVFVVTHLLGTSHDNPASNLSESENRSPRVIVGKKGMANVPIALEDVAFIKLRNGLPFLTNFHGVETILSENLDHYEKILPQSDFFRANRQIIINRLSCESFKAVENGKIQVLLKPEIHDSVMVSQKRASKFRTWVKQ